MKNTIFATSSQNKIIEYERILGYKINHRSLDVPEIQSLDYRKIIIDKAKKAYTILKQPVIVEDSGMVFSAWKVLPGPLWRFFEERETGIEYSDLLCNMLANFTDKSAIGTTIFGYCDGKILKTFIGETSGKIVCPARGRNGFGYDSIFIPNGEIKTFAQMSLAQKDRHSPRAKALKKLKHFFIKL